MRDARGSQVDPWDALNPEDEPPITGFPMDDDDAMGIIGRLCIGAAGSLVIQRDSDDYKQALCNIQYARNVTEYVAKVVLPYEMPGADKAMIVMDLCDSMKQMDIDDSSIRDASGAKMDPSVTWQQHFLDTLCARRAAAGIYVTGAS